VVHSGPNTLHGSRGKRQAVNVTIAGLKLEVLLPMDETTAANVFQRTHNSPERPINRMRPHPTALDHWSRRASRVHPGQGPDTHGTRDPGCGRQCQPRESTSRILCIILGMLTLGDGS
jgi:hypothetical protein